MGQGPEGKDSGIVPQKGQKIKMTNLDELIRGAYALHDQLDSLFVRLLNVRDKVEYNSEMWKDLTDVIDTVMQIQHGGERREAV